MTSTYLVGRFNYQTESVEWLDLRQAENKELACGAVVGRYELSGPLEHMFAVKVSTHVFSNGLHVGKL